MIETMLTKTVPYLPLEIFDIRWGNGELQLRGTGWNFIALSAWRLSFENRVLFGCYDSDVQEEIEIIKGLQIIRIECQEKLLKIYPVFILSNGQRIEIFSTRTVKPLTLEIEKLGVFLGGQNEPDESLVI